MGKFDFLPADPPRRWRSERSRFPAVLFTFVLLSLVLRGELWEGELEEAGEDVCSVPF